ncbi:hypothetical protein PR048_013840 [Dryococelus australis]|uniref:PiggyBac transposable element-derived protein domain-containing protein n=1 Tax=Dryococelus australis TaxID=614101 RepID=A0ABQ9HTB3_9NEOP|nr:hypothetical protein PR048_013840 [Dryococelus australis]
MAELEAFISIIIARGAYAAKGLELSTLWSSIWGPSFFTQTMARNIYFSNEWDFSALCEMDSYKKVLCVTNLYMSSCSQQQLDVHLRNTWPINHVNLGSRYKYLVNRFPYFGKEDDLSSDQLLGSYIVLLLLELYLQCGRNVTKDNLFTSLELSWALNDKKTRLVSIVNCTRRKVPLIAKNFKQQLYATYVYKHKDTTLTVYQGKFNNNVILLSSLHPSVNIAANEETPETIQYYNFTQFGVDMMDQMARKHYVKSASRHWPVHVFFNVLDLACINAWILYKEVTGRKIKRMKFILELCK